MITPTATALMVAMHPAPVATVLVRRAFFDEHTNWSERTDVDVDHAYAVTSYAVERLTFDLDGQAFDSQLGSRSSLGELTRTLHRSERATVPGVADEESTHCARCFGEVHPDALACRHCGASFEDDGWLTPVQRAVLAWVAAAVSFVTGWTLIELANANDEFSMLGAVLFLAAIPLAIVAVYYTMRAAARS